MPIITLRLVLGVLFFSLSSFAYADFSTPAGIWDIQGVALVSGKFAGGKLRNAPKTSVYSFVQFKDNGAYTTIPWLASSGHWQGIKGKKTYQVSFDFSEVVSGKARAPFLNVMLSQYLKLVQTKYAKVAAFNSIDIKSYTDRGKLLKKGMWITGTHKISANVMFTNPDTQQDVAGSVKMTLVYRGTRASAPSTCCTSDDVAQNQADSEAFLKENAKVPGVQQTASGLQYLILSKGDGATPTVSDKVTVSYRGILPSGQLFDNNNGLPASFILKNVIPGFTEGLQLMKVGSYYRLYLPPELAYGASGRGTVIKPNTALIFDVSLQKIN